MPLCMIKWEWLIIHKHTRESQWQMKRDTTAGIEVGRGPAKATTDNPATTKAQHNNTMQNGIEACMIRGE